MILGSVTFNNMTSETFFLTYLFMWIMLSWNYISGKTLALITLWKPYNNMVLIVLRDNMRLEQCKIFQDNIDSVTQPTKALLV